MIIDCGSCTVRGAACSDCVVTFLTIPVRDPSHADHPPHAGHPPHADRPASAPVPAALEALPGRGPESVDLDEAERRAIDLLSRSGLVPPLRMRAM